MINKIGQKIEKSYLNTVVTKTFQRGLQTVTSKVASFNRKVYFKSWRVDEYNKSRQICQAYNDGKPIKESRYSLDLLA